MYTTKAMFDDYQAEQVSGYSDNDWQEIYEDEQLSIDYLNWQIEEAETQALEAQQAAVTTTPELFFIEQLVASHNAVQSTLSELTTLLLNVGSSYIRHDVHRIASDLIKKSGLMEGTKEIYQQMIDAANNNSQHFFNGHLTAA